MQRSMLSATLKSGRYLKCSLRSGYTPHTRQSIGGNLLDTVHANITARVKTDLEGKTVTLMRDGWSDIDNTPVIASSVHTGEKSYFCVYPPPTLEQMKRQQHTVPPLHKTVPPLHKTPCKPLRICMCVKSRQS